MSGFYAATGLLLCLMLKESMRLIVVRLFTVDSEGGSAPLVTPIAAAMADKTGKSCFGNVRRQC
jgi:hypothetical protein